ncbi:RNA polymerase sigma factor [Micromonospora sp. CPCC 206061]|uniref:RNA polymerase sigma factor n=1 Tax=Micromonospora sp. CPCC 206061 TaxID=3122410 RepID=UPI002FEF4F1D
MTEDIDALRAGDEQAFRELVRAHQSVLLRLAMVYAPSRAVAEEIVQETWIAVLRGVDGFDGRASLRTWISRILVNIARRRAGQEAQTIPLSVLGGDDDEPTIDPDRFQSHGPYAGHWVKFPDDWSRLPEDVLLASEIRHTATSVIEQLSPAQRTVIVLRDMEGWSSAEICQLLDITDVHQRVLLHRARAKVRHALEDYLGPRMPPEEPGSQAREFAPPTP